MDDGDLMRAAFAAAGTGMYAFDDRGAVVVVNDRAVELLGRSREQLVGIVAHDLFHHSAFDGTLQDARTCRIMATTRTMVADYEDDDVFWRGDESALPVWWISAPIPPSAGVAADMRGVVVFGDASDRRRRDAEADAEIMRLTLLTSLSERLNSLDVLSGLDHIAELATEQLADACVIDRVDPLGRVARVSLSANDVASRQLTTELHPMPPVSAHSRGSLAAVLRDGAPQRIVELPLHDDDRPHADGLDEAQGRLFDTLGARHAIVVPLSAHGRVLGAMTWVRRDLERPFDATDALMARLFGGRIGQWMDNLRLVELQQQAAVTLQRSLLTALPEPDHLQLVARYQPAGEGVEVGGDWYDAVVSYDGHTTVMIGDVAGHDVSAAAEMAQLRSIMRYAALLNPLDPAQVLADIDTAMPPLGVTNIASAVLAGVTRDDDGGHVLVWSNAGHPPPLLVTPDGAATLLERDAEIGLGAVVHASRSNHRHSLRDGATLVLYTDGLVERRGEHIDDGLARLQAAAADLADQQLDDFCDGLLKQLTPDAGLSDDVALIAVRLFPEDRPRPPEAGSERVFGRD